MRSKGTYKAKELLKTYYTCSHSSGNDALADVKQQSASEEPEAVAKGVLIS